jgi:hypothetical protein
VHVDQEADRCGQSKLRFMPATRGRILIRFGSLIAFSGLRGPKTIALGHDDLRLAFTLETVPT